MAIREKEIAIRFVAGLMDMGANFTVSSKAFTIRGGHGNDNILDEGFNYSFNISRIPGDMDSLMNLVNELSLHAKWNAGEGWDFYE